MSNDEEMKLQTTPMAQFAHRAKATFKRGLAVALTALAVLPAAYADNFPSRAVSLWIPFPPGGSTDAVLRTLAAGAATPLGQQVVPINKPGAGATLAASVMAQTAEPDGYTVSMIAANIFRMPHLQKVTYDPLKDFTYIIGLTNYRYGIVVRQDAPWKNLEELLAYAKANPNKLTYGSVGIGSAGHIAMERLAKAANFKATFVPYKGSEELISLMAGEIDVVVDPGWGSFAANGKMRPLAIVGDNRFPRFKDVPTLKELGYDITAASQVGIVGPKNMDPKVVKTLHDALKKATESPTYQKALEAIDMEPIYMSSDEYKKFAADQFERERRFVQQLNIKLN